MTQNLNTQMWQDDLTWLADSLRQHHATAYPSRSKEQFDKAVEALAAWGRQGIDRALEQCAVYEPDAALDFEIL